MNAKDTEGKHNSDQPAQRNYHASTLVKNCNEALKRWVESEHAMGTILDSVGEMTERDRWTVFRMACIGLAVMLVARPTAYPTSLLLCTLYPLHQTQRAVTVFMIYLYLPPFRGARKLFEQWINPVRTIISGELDKGVIVGAHPLLLKTLHIDKQLLERTNVTTLVSIFRHPAIQKFISCFLPLVTSAVASAGARSSPDSRSPSDQTAEEDATPRSSVGTSDAPLASQSRGGFATDVKDTEASEKSEGSTSTSSSSSSPTNDIEYLLDVFKTFSRMLKNPSDHARSLDADSK
ncbi:unnamed protein product [Soboliphyme baturini]|uniref:Transmembrane protein n=1 Tax=Soboliphyme baturini TaxID=241478 RepID=A0A183IQV7_9BILA|nr:unnamed protein product [Soboliphyme baturini]